MLVSATIITTATTVKLLGKETTHMVYMAELTGVTLALELAADKPYPHLIIFINNQVVIWALADPD